MATTGYEISSSQSGYLYWFISVGTKGSIMKVVRLQPLKEVGHFNLAMGDVINNDISYFNVTNNNDRDKVFATIAEIVRLFLTRFPRNHVFVTGNTPAKIRLYQMLVSNNLELISREFKVYGQKQLKGRFKKFKKGESYSGILISNK